MTDTDLKKLTLVDAAHMIAQRKISAREMADAVISRIERLNPEFCAFISVIHPDELDDARSSGAKALSGVPISVKDLYDTKGIRTTAGSKVFAERIPEEDATVVKKLKDAGGVIVGKNNLHEFAFGVTTVNPHYGIARNPWDRERISRWFERGIGKRGSARHGFRITGFGYRWFDPNSSFGMRRRRFEANLWSCELARSCSAFVVSGPRRSIDAHRARCGCIDGRHCRL
jgi:hypothetical protein